MIDFTDHKNLTKEIFESTIDEFSIGHGNYWPVRITKKQIKSIEPDRDHSKKINMWMVYGTGTTLVQLEIV